MQVCVVSEVGTGNLDDIAGETFEVNVSLFDGTAIGMHNVYMHVATIILVIMLSLFTKVVAWTTIGLPHQQS